MSLFELPAWSDRACSILGSFTPDSSCDGAIPCKSESANFAYRATYQRTCTRKLEQWMSAFHTEDPEAKWKKKPAHVRQCRQHNKFGMSWHWGKGHLLCVVRVFTMYARGWHYTCRGCSSSSGYCAGCIFNFGRRLTFSKCASHISLEIDGRSSVQCNRCKVWIGAPQIEGFYYPHEVMLVAVHRNIVGKARH